MSNHRQGLFSNLLQSGYVQMIHAGIKEHGFVSWTISTVSWKFAINVNVTGQMNLHSQDSEGKYGK